MSLSQHAVPSPTEPPRSGGRVSQGMMDFYLAHLIFPFSPYFSQSQKANLFVTSPPLALVALSPSLRLFCEREKPYRLGGAWFLSHEHAWQGEAADGAAQRSNSNGGGDGRETSKEKIDADVPKDHDDEDDEEDEDDDDDGTLDAAWAGSRTRAGLTMGALPAHLGNVRLFQYLENTPSSWIGFCTTVARGLPADLTHIAGLSGDAPAAHDGLSPPLCPSEPASPSSTSPLAEERGSAPHASYLYLVCTHPEGRLALSLWWTYQRRRHLARDAVRHASQRRTYKAAALIVCADLTYFSRVEKRGLFVPPSLEADRAAEAAAAVPPLLTYVFLNGAVTLAVEEELQQQWWAEHMPAPQTVASAHRSHTALSPSASPGTADEEEDEEEADDVSSTMEDVMLVEPFLADCAGSQMDLSAPFGFPTSPTGARRRFDPSTAFAAATQLHVLHVRLALAESARLAAPWVAHGAHPEAAGKGEGGAWDVQWLARLFPHLTQLRLDGPSPVESVVGRGARYGQRPVLTAGRLVAAVNRRDMTSPTSASPSARHVTPDTETSLSAGTVQTVCGLRHFVHLRSLYLRDCYFSSIPLNPAVSRVSTTPPPSSTLVSVLGGPAPFTTHTLSLADRALPATLKEVSIVGSKLLNEHGLTTSPTSDPAPPSLTHGTLPDLSADSTAADVPQPPTATPPRPQPASSSSSLPPHAALDLHVLSFVSVAALKRVDVLLSRIDGAVRHLTHLELSKTGVDTAALRAAALPHRTPALRVLRLTGTLVDDVTCLLGLPQLEVLNLSSSPITPAGLRGVPFFPALRELFLMQCWCLLTIKGGSEADEDGPAARGMMPPPPSTPHTTAAPIFTFVHPDEPDDASDAGDRRAFPALECLDLSNNPLLSEAHIFPPVAFFEARLARCPVPAPTAPTAPLPRRRRPQARPHHCLRAPDPIFPVLRRLSLMHTAVAQLGLLPWMAPRLRVLDVSYTNTTSPGLWATPLLRTSGSMHVVVPQPLRLLRLELAGTPVTSLRPLSPLQTAVGPLADAVFPRGTTATMAGAMTVPAVGFTWLPALRHLRLSGSDITPEGVAAGLVGARGRLRSLFMAGTAVVAPPIAYAVSIVPPPVLVGAAGPPPDAAVPHAAQTAAAAAAPEQAAGLFPAAAEARVVLDRSAQADAASELHAVLRAHAALRACWHPSDPARALWVTLFENATSLTRLDLSRTAVPLDAFFEPRRTPLRVAAAVRLAWDEGIASLTHVDDVVPTILVPGSESHNRVRAASTGSGGGGGGNHDAADLQHVPLTASGLLRLVGKGGVQTTASSLLLDGENTSGPTSVSSFSELALSGSHSATPAQSPWPHRAWHVLLWRLLLSGQLLQSRHPSLHLAQLSLSDTPCATLVREHVVASARVQAATLSTALAPFQPATPLTTSPSTAGATLADEATMAAFDDLWTRDKVEPHVWHQLEKMSPKDVRGIEFLVRETLFGPQCTFS